MAGESIALQVQVPENTRIDTVTWKLDGETLQGTRLELPEGEHTLEARVLYEDAREEILRAQLMVD